MLEQGNNEGDALRKASRRIGAAWLQLTDVEHALGQLNYNRQTPVASDALTAVSAAVVNLDSAQRAVVQRLRELGEET